MDSKKHHLVIYILAICLLCVSCASPNPLDNLSVEPERDPCWLDLCVNTSRKSDVLQYIRQAEGISDYSDIQDQGSDFTRVDIVYSRRMQRETGFRRVVAYYRDVEDFPITRIGVTVTSGFTFQQVVDRLGSPEFVTANYASSPGFDLIVGFLYPAEGISVWSHRIPWKSDQETYAVSPEWKVNYFLLFSETDYDVTGFRDDEYADDIQPWPGWDNPIEILDISPF